MTIEQLREGYKRITGNLSAHEEPNVVIQKRAELQNAERQGGDPLNGALEIFWKTLASDPRILGAAIIENEIGDRYGIQIVDSFASDTQESSVEALEAIRLAVDDPDLRFWYLQAEDKVGQDYADWLIEAFNGPRKQATEGDQVEEILREASIAGRASQGESILSIVMFED